MSTQLNNSQAASEWIEIPQGDGTFHYFNKRVLQCLIKLMQTGATVFEKPNALRMADE